MIARLIRMLFPPAPHNARDQEVKAQLTIYGASTRRHTVRTAAPRHGDGRHHNDSPGETK